MDEVIKEIAKTLNELQLSETDNEVIKPLAEILIDLDLVGES
jgi:chaperonin cofactor prefoldin